MSTIIQYPGGKRLIAPKILSELGPIESWSGYCEPFAGGLAVLWAARASGYSGHAVIGEVQPHIRGLWLWVQRNGPEVLVWARHYLDRAYSSADPEAEYYAIRGEASDPPEDEVGAGRLLFLLRSGFNGLVRFGPKGPNVPAGTAIRSGLPIYLPNPEQMLRAQAWLQGVTILGSADEALNAARKRVMGCRIYADPPYIGTHAYSSSWRRSDRVVLGANLAELAGLGARCVTSELDTSEARYDLHELDPSPITISVRRKISRKADGRILVGEAIWRGGATTRSTP